MLLPRRKLVLSRRALLRRSLLAAPALILPRRASAQLQLLGAGANQPGGGGSGPPPYVASAVNFDGLTTQISVPLPFIGGSNTGKFIASWWMANTVAGADSHHSDVLPLCSYPNGLITIGSQGFINNGPTPFIADFYDGTASFNLQEILSNDNIYPVTPWTHFAVNVDLEHADPNKVQQYYINGAPAGFTNDFSYAPSLIVSLSEESLMYVGTDGFSDRCAFDLSDMQFWAGTSTDFSLTIGKLISGGKPVNPSVAAAAFGPQTILFSGDQVGFPINGGTGGTATLTGPLTNAATHP